MSLMPFFIFGSLYARRYMSGKQIGYYLERTTRQVKLAFTKAFNAHDIDLTPEQWVILDHLLMDNGVSQNELASKSYKNAPTVSRILDVLERKEYIERQRFDNDRRRYKIYLTQKGSEVAKKALPIAVSMRENGWTGLSEDDYTDFIRIIETVFDNFDPS